MSKKRNPGIIIPFNPDTDRFKIKGFSGFKVICSESASDEISLKIQFEIKLKGILKQNEFDADEIDPVGDGHLYIPFDDPAEKSISYFGSGSMIDIIDPDSGNAPANLRILVTNTGKTRWGMDGGTQKLNIDKLM